MIADSIEIDPRKIRPAPGGGILIDGRIGRSGVQEYKRPDGATVRVLRPRDEVMAADFTGSPLTVGHPSGGVTPDNFQTVAVGHSKARAKVDVVAGQVYPVHTLQVNDGETIRRIKAGELAELSCCYDVTQDPTPGVADGQEYDLIFRDLVPNHIALGPKGFARAGENAKLLVADGAAQETVLMNKNLLPDRIADSGESNTPDTSGRDALVAENATLKAENARLVKVADDANAALAAAEGAKTAAEANAAKVPELIAKGIADGIAFREASRKILGAEYVFDGKDVSEVKTDIRAAKVARLAELDSTIKVADGAEDGWIDGALAAAEKYAKPHDYNEGAPVADGSAPTNDFAAHVRVVSAKAFGGII